MRFRTESEEFAGESGGCVGGVLVVVFTTTEERALFEFGRGVVVVIVVPDD